MADGPAFVGIGSRLANWRRWAGLLAEHPETRFPTAGTDGKGVELAFFQRFCEEPMTDADVADYRSRFRGDGVAGEWTARYMMDPWVMPLLARAAPDAKLLVLLSDPIMRYRIRLAHWPPEMEGYQQMVSMADAVERGRFAEQLRLVHTCFDPSQVLVQQQERCDADPLGEYRRMLSFVGVDPSFVPRSMRREAAGKPPQGGLVRALSAAGVTRRVPDGVRRRLGLPVHRPPADLWPDVELSLHEELDGEMVALAELVPGFDLSLWPSFAHLASRTPA